MSENISLLDLLNLSIGYPQEANVNFAALHTLLLAMLRQLDLREVRTRWRDAPTGDPPAGVTAPSPEEQQRPAQKEMSGSQQEVQPGTELQQRSASPPPPTHATSGVAAAGFQSRIQSCEDGVSKAMKIIGELHGEKNNLKDEIKELRQQQKMFCVQSETAAAVEKCCHRVDALEQAVESLRDSVQKNPDPEDLSQFVTREEFQSVLLSERQNLGKWSGSRDASTHLMHQLNQHRALIDSLLSDREKLDHLEDMLMNRKSRDSETGSEAASESVETDSREYQELSRQVSYLRRSVQKLEADLEQLKVKQGQREEKTADQHFQDQLNDLRGSLEEVMQNLIPQLSVSLQDEAGQEQRDDRAESSSSTSSSVKVERQLSSLLQHYDQLQDQVNRMNQQQSEGRAGTLQDTQERQLNRMELDSVKKQLEDLWKNIQEKFQAQEAPEHEDAAGFRKQLVERFRCLSCDRPIVKQTPGPRKPGTNRYKFEVCSLERRRQSLKRLTKSLEEQKQNPAEGQHDRISELTDLGHLVVSRSCGGSHTNTWTNQRRSNLLKHHGAAEEDAKIQSEEVDIVGQDGHIYKGRQNISTSRNAETKLPTISTKDASSKTEDKSRTSPSHKPAASPETHQPLSARANPGSRSASSLSGRDWPVSALGCASQSSSSSSERHSSEPLGL
nr:PREDICTED: glutamine-rich protein 2-like [Stegastes partitus]